MRYDLPQSVRCFLLDNSSGQVIKYLKRRQQNLKRLTHLAANEPAVDGVQENLHSAKYSKKKKKKKKSSIQKQCNISRNHSEVELLVRLAQLFLSGPNETDKSEAGHGREHDHTHLQQSLARPFFHSLLLLLHAPLPVSHLPFSLELLPVVTLIKGVKIKLDLFARLGEAPFSALMLLLLRGTRWPTCGLLWGRSACALKVWLAQEAAVILPPQSDVTQDCVSFADFRKALCGCLAARVLVRVVNEGLFVVGCLDLGLRGAGGHLQDVVISRLAPVHWGNFCWAVVPSPAVASRRCGDSRMQFRTPECQAPWPLCQDEGDGAEGLELLVAPDSVRMWRPSTYGPGCHSAMKQLLVQPHGEEHSCLINPELRCWTRL